MKLYIGLGNPDKKYQNTRHNIGHSIIEILKNKNLPSSKFGTNDGFMNEAGTSVQKLVHFYKIDLSDFYLIHDDLDLPLGEATSIRQGPAGHHGVESVIQHLGTQAFNRIRVGIGKPTNNVPVEDYVLQQFTSEEKSILQKTIDKIVEELMGH